MKQPYKYSRDLLLGFTLAILAVASCTKDYFEDENNFKLYIPQIKEGSIDNVLVAIHDEATGQHRYTRFIEGPFDPNTIGRDGILRFKLPRGEQYNVSCFANIDPASYSEGSAYTASFVSEPLPGGSAYYGSGPDFRVVLDKGITAWPLDHPDGAIPHTVDLNETCVYKGRVLCEFKELPSQVARIDIIYKGVGTHMGYTGHYGRPTGFYVAASYPVQDSRAALADFQTGPEPLFPSAGMHYTEENADGCEKLALEVCFVDAGGGEIGRFTGLHAEDSPTVTDPQGQPVAWDFLLRPRYEVKFVFKGFMLFEIELVGWGDIDQGEITPF